ncbi:MAG: DsbA family protein [Candidatus Kerfeldbacteria bacterium]|nr:DsbA family protein [Candidatus Kerfeldbacteria bacterium]
MEPATPRASRRWYHSGGFAAVLIVVAIGAVVFSINRNSRSGGSQQLTIDPAALAAVPQTNVNVVSADDPWFGNRDAAVVVVEFGDFQCPFCQRVFPAVRALMTKYRDRVLFIFRDFPVTQLHPEAAKAAEAGQCAWEQGSDEFWALHDRLFLNQEDLTVPALKAYAASAGLDTGAFDSCLDSGGNAGEVSADYADGLAAGVQGTPTFFVNGRRYSGALPQDVLEDIITLELNAAQ